MDPTRFREEQCEILMGNDLPGKALATAIEFVPTMRMKYWKPSKPPPDNGNKFCYINTSDIQADKKTCDGFKEAGSKFIKNAFIDEGLDVTQTFPTEKCVFEIDPEKVNDSSLTQFWSSVKTIDCSQQFELYQKKISKMKYDIVNYDRLMTTSNTIFRNCNVENENLNNTKQTNIEILKQLRFDISIMKGSNTSLENSIEYRNYEASQVLTKYKYNQDLYAAYSNALNNRLSNLNSFQVKLNKKQKELTSQLDTYTDKSNVLAGEYARKNSSYETIRASYYIAYSNLLSLTGQINTLQPIFNSCTSNVAEMREKLKQCTKIRPEIKKTLSDNQETLIECNRQLNNCETAYRDCLVAQSNLAMSNEKTILLYQDCQREYTIVDTTNQMLIAESNTLRLAISEWLRTHYKCDFEKNQLESLTQKQINVLQTCRTQDIAKYDMKLVELKQAEVQGAIDQVQSCVANSTTMYTSISEPPAPGPMPPKLANIPDQTGRTSALSPFMIDISQYQMISVLQTKTLTWSVCVPPDSGISIDPVKGLLKVEKEANGITIKISVVNPIGASSSQNVKLNIILTPVTRRAVTCYSDSPYMSDHTFCKANNDNGQWMCDKYLPGKDSKYVDNSVMPINGSRAVYYCEYEGDKTNEANENAKIAQLTPNPPLFLVGVTRNYIQLWTNSYWWSVGHSPNNLESAVANVVFLITKYEWANETQPGKGNNIIYNQRQGGWLGWNITNENASVYNTVLGEPLNCGLTDTNTFKCGYINFNAGSCDYGISGLKHVLGDYSAERVHWWNWWVHANSGYSSISFDQNIFDITTYKPILNDLWCNSSNTDKRVEDRRDIDWFPLRDKSATEITGALKYGSFVNCDASLFSGKEIQIPAGHMLMLWEASQLTYYNTATYHVGPILVKHYQMPISQYQAFRCLTFRGNNKIYEFQWDKIEENKEYILPFGCKDLVIPCWINVEVKIGDINHLNYAKNSIEDPYYDSFEKFG